MNQSNNHENFYKENNKYSEFLSKQNIENFQKYVDKILEYMPKGGNFLDVGCGVGHTLVGLKKNGIDARGIDISETSVNICKDNELDCVAYDGNHIPYPDENFDVVGSYNVFEHVDNTENFIKENLRVLKKGGHLILVCPNFLSITNSYHWHTKGLIQKIKNLFSLMYFKLTNNVKIQKMKTYVNEIYMPDDDACNVTNPVQIITLLKSFGCRVVYYSSNSVYKSGLASKLDFVPASYLFGSSFIIFEK